jgi:RNA polymerase sigma-70 factor (ECF subfamily)
MAEDDKNRCASDRQPLGELLREVFDSVDQVIERVTDDQVDLRLNHLLNMARAKESTPATQSQESGKMLWLTTSRTGGLARPQELQTAFALLRNKIDGSLARAWDPWEPSGVTAQLARPFDAHPGDGPKAEPSPTSPISLHRKVAEEEPRHVSVGSIWQLVEQAQAGDAGAFGQLYNQYVDVVYRYVYYRIGDRSTAEDFTSETFLRAWRRIGSVTDQGGDIGAWFVTIARNIVLDHVKSNRYRLEVATADMLDADRHEDGPEGAVLDRTASAELLAAVRQLSADQQECIVLRFLQGLSVAETAAVMGKNEGTIRVLQRQAVRRLATLLPDGFR